MSRVLVRCMFGTAYACVCVCVTGFECLSLVCVCVVCGRYESGDGVMSIDWEKSKFLSQKLGMRHMPTHVCTTCDTSHACNRPMTHHNVSCACGMCSTLPISDYMCVCVSNRQLTVEY